MRLHTATHDAVREYSDARRALIRAIHHDLDHGVSDDDIAAMAAPILPRDVVLAYLAAEHLRDRARTALHDAGIRGHVDVGADGALETSTRSAYLVLAVGPHEVSDDDRSTLLSRIVDALQTAGVALLPPDDGSIDEQFWNGEALRLLHR
ncbi:hypothetical protein ACWEV3_40235 [Saccharopolyspora sp. NPDC003752]